MTHPDEIEPATVMFSAVKKACTGTPWDERVKADVRLRTLPWSPRASARISFRVIRITEDTGSRIA